MPWSWRRRRPPASNLEACPDATNARLAELAQNWRRDPGVTPWPDEHTRPLPIITPAARHRGWGRQ